MSSTNTTTGNGSSGGSAFGRMFRRYSQGGGRSDSQRPSTRDRDRERDRDRDLLNSNMSRNTSSPALARDTSSPSPARGSPHHPLPRSVSTNSQLVSRSSGENGSMPPSRTLAVLADASEPPAASRSSPSPAAGSVPALVALSPSSGVDAGGAAAAASGAPIEVAETDNANVASRLAKTVHRIRLVPHLEATRSLHFEPIERDVKEGTKAVKVGRFTDRQPSQPDANTTTLAGVPDAASGTAMESSIVHNTRGQPGARGGAIPVSGSNGGGGRIDSSRIAFKSKVVSRGHAEVWCEAGGKFFIRDTKSSSGTFLNHIRLSAPNVESKPFAIKDGDVIQLGVDYQGGTEEIYRCVKMRVELNRGWQREANQFNVNALRQLRALQGTPLTPAEEKGKSASQLPTNRQSVSVTDCCICLFSVTVCQALFIAPCSHVFHYKCIRPLLNLHHPGFSCPLCRTFADLDADVEEDEAWQEALTKEAAAAEALAAQGKMPLDVGTPAVEVDAPIASAAFSSATHNANDVTRINPVPNVPLSAAAAVLQAATGLAPSAAMSGDTTAAGDPVSLLAGRGIAAPSRRKNDWARPDTAVGSSAGPMAEDETLALSNGESLPSHDEAAGLAAAVDEMVVADHLLNETAGGPATSSSPHARSRQASMDAGSPYRRGSGPIAIGGGATTTSPSTRSSSQPRSRNSGSTYPDGAWPTLASVGGFSPGLDEAGTPLNNTFLSTLAEAPQALSVNGQRDFRQGRSAPAQRLVPASSVTPFSNALPETRTGDRTEAHDASTRTESSVILAPEHVPSAGAGMSNRQEHEMLKTRSSDGGEDVDTAEEEQGGPSLGALRGFMAGVASAGKGKGRTESKDLAAVTAGSTSPGVAFIDGAESKTFDEAARHASPRSQSGRTRSRSRSRGGVGRRDPAPSDSEDQEASPYHSHEHPTPPRTGPNLNASAYMSHSHATSYRPPTTSLITDLPSQSAAASLSAASASTTASPAEGKMSRFKRRISHAI